MREASETWKQAADMMSAASPIPQVEIKTSLAPGKRGPVGTAPRTDYSKVNTGIAPASDAGGMEQKSMAPRGAEMLPKIASEDSMGTGTAAVRPTINDMVKKAMAGMQESVKIDQEASRQAANMGELTQKTAAVAQVPVTEQDQAEKLANALEFLAEELKKEGAHLGGPYTLREGHVEPGKGPGALQVHESDVKGKDPFKPGNQGHGHSGQVAHSPAEDKTTSAGPATQMANNMNSPAGFHEHQDLSMVNQRGTKVAGEKEKCKGCDKEKDACVCSSKSAAAYVRAKLASDKKLEAEETKGMETAKQGLERAEKAHEKEANAFAALADIGRQHVKQAEDAINPAQISAGAAVPPDTREAGQTGGVAPAGGQTGLVASNDAARDYKKSTAKSVPKSDLTAYVKEPALSGATDKTLAMAFTHTGEAGTKFAADTNVMAGSAKTAAARAILQKLAEEADTKKGAV